VLNKDVPITQLQKDLGIGSYRSALRLKKTVLQVLEEWSATPEARKVGPDYVAMHRDDEMRKVFRDFIDFYSKQFLPNHPSFAATEFLSEYRAHLDDEHKMVFDDAVTGTNTGKDLMPRYRYRAAKEIYRHIFEFSIKKIGEIG